MRMETVLSVKRLSVRAKEKTIVENISFDIGEGEAVLLSGANGSGKSTILKAIVGESTIGKDISGSIVVKGFGDVLSLNAVDLSRYRASIIYVQQRDSYGTSEIGNTIRVRDIISQSNEAYSGKPLRYSEVNNLIDKWLPSLEGNKRIFDAKSKPVKFSGGEQRLLSVLSAIAPRTNAGLIIIDEPLNNLDFSNARHISNLLNSVVKSNPKAAILIITHCRIFPFIKREIKLTPEGIRPVIEPYTFFSCMGETDDQGFYTE